MTSDTKKRMAAAKALDFIDDGMTVGLGTGSTAEHFVELLAKQAWDGLHVTCVSTSIRTTELAQKRGLDVCDLDKVARIHVTVDGADEVDPNLCLIKGGGGALLREKIVATASDRMVVIADDSKMVDPLGAFPLPVEVAPFGFSVTANKVLDVLKSESCPGLKISLREQEDGHPFVTDGGHYILDCACEAIRDPHTLAEKLNAIAGVVDHGLFIDIATALIMGGDEDVKVIEK